MVNGMEGKPWLAKQSAVIIFALCVLALSSITNVEAAGEGAVAPSSFTTDTLGIVDNSAREYGVAGQEPRLDLGHHRTSFETFLRSVETTWMKELGSGRISVQDLKVDMRQN